MMGLGMTENQLEKSMEDKMETEVCSGLSKSEEHGSRCLV